MREHFGIKIAAVLVFAFILSAGSTTFSRRSEEILQKVVYKTETLIITQVAKNSFVHTSFKQTNDFGNVPCNGLVVTTGNEAIVFDTPSDDATTLELIKWISETRKLTINAVVATHFHDDSLGGLKAFHDKGVPSYGYSKTIELAKKTEFAPPQNGFADSLTLKVGKKKIIAKFFGEGHSKDNIVGYFAEDKILFGGCLIKELNAGKGYLGDANVAAWSGTVDKIKKAFPKVKIVVPGHGETGDKELLDFTSRLFRNE